MNSPSSEEEAAIIVAARARLAWVDSLPERERMMAANGIPEEDWPRVTAWIDEFLRLTAKPQDG
jgi:hypothetical protein